MKLSNFQNILILRLSSLGDVILTSPLIRTIKNSYPHLNIDFLVRKEYEDVVKYNPNLNQIIGIKTNYNLKTLRNQIYQNKYDLIIDLQNNLRSRKITKSVSSQIVRYKKPYLNRVLLVKLKINRFIEILPISVRYANSIPNFMLDDKGLELFLPKNANSKLNDNNRYIGLCPGSKHKTKMWPEGYFIKLGNDLVKNNYKIVLFGGKDDKDICRYISNKIIGSVDLSNDNNLFDLAANMKKCKVLICNDSGLMHTGLAVDIPIMAIFGSTVKELGFFPYKGNNLVLENNSLSCRPCSHIGLDKCPKNHLNCMNEILPSYVLQKTLNFIQ